MDGRFRVMGKVTKVGRGNEKIDLLRNTSFTLFKANMLNGMLKAFNSNSNEENGMN